jgi:hypothetical protein
MKRRLLHLLALTLLITFSKTISACICSEYGTPVCAAYWRADVVFVGQLRDITPPQSTPSGVIPTATLHFVVEEAFRGVNTQEVDVTTLSGTDCDMPFGKSLHYLVYASRDSEKNRLFAGLCGRTTTLQHASEDLNYLRTLKQQGVPESISGRVALQKYQPMSGVKVEVQGVGKVFETTTDKEGNYSVSLNRSGSYTVKILVPDAVLAMSSRNDRIKAEPTRNLTTLEYEVNLEKNQCDYHELDVFTIDLSATAVVSGIIRNNQGRAITQGLVYLVNSADRSDRRFKEIGSDGSFKFEDVAIGEFFVVVNPDNGAPGENDVPYPRTFYPGVRDEESATRIVVAEGVKLENLSFRLEAPWKAKTISGKVTWPDGSPAVNAHVSLYAERRYIRIVDVDKKGFFSFEVYGDFNYEVIAQVWDQHRQGKSTRVKIKEKSTDLKLVINPE